MHYIRLLRPPTLDGPPSRPILKLVLTITTDLGDSFLFPQRPVDLAVLVDPAQHHQDGASFTNVTPKKNPPRWQAGMRVLKLDLPWPPGLTGTIQIRPTDPNLIASSASHVISDSQGKILPVYVVLPAPGMEIPRVSLRRLDHFQNGRADAVSRIEIQEELGESIARHVWDAGIATVSVLADLHSQTAAGGDRLAWLRNIFSGDKSRPLSVLELGCGVGILGIGIAGILRATFHTADGSCVLMTDLAEAEECARANIARFTASRQVLLDGAEVEVQYENLDWEDGKLGKFGPEVRSRAWDLVVLSDCTYNVDMLPTLVQTLSALHSAGTRQPDRQEGSWETNVLLATKPRHPSEEALFNLMAESGWCVREKATLPLPVLDTEAQTVEIYLFSKG